MHLSVCFPISTFKKNLDPGQRYVVYIGWPIACSYMTQMRGKGGGSCGVSANEYSCTHGAQIKFGDLTPYLTYAWTVRAANHYKLTLPVLDHRFHFLQSRGGTLYSLWTAWMAQFVPQILSFKLYNWSYSDLRWDSANIFTKNRP